MDKAAPDGHGHGSTSYRGWKWQSGQWSTFMPTFRVEIIKLKSSFKMQLPTLTNEKILSKKPDPSQQPDPLRQKPAGGRDQVFLQTPVPTAPSPPSLHGSFICSVPWPLQVAEFETLGTFSKWFGGQKTKTL